MNRQYLKDEELPFCKGCTHTTIAESTDRALQKLGLPLLDVIMVTDIGCHGIIDKSFNTHTVHGLHGRSVALATGISAAIRDPAKKVIVFIGDGGVTIGIQHFILAAHKNYNLTVVVHNNMLYGMTGGQPSEFTPLGFRTPTLPHGAGSPGADICEIATAAGANYVSRIIGIGDISDPLAEAFSKPGFSLVEVMEICTSYGVKSNPGMKLSKVVEESGLEVKIFADRNGNVYQSEPREDLPSLITALPSIPSAYQAAIDQPVRIMISGSAGEGVQSAADLLAMAAISAGLNVTKKGSYPVTVGIGYSSAEIILSPEKILYTGSPVPDILIITSEDGLGFAMPYLKRMKTGMVLIDISLSAPASLPTVTIRDLREPAGSRNVSLFSLIVLLTLNPLIPLEALLGQIRSSKLGEKLNLDKLLDKSLKHYKHSPDPPVKTGGNY